MRFEEILPYLESSYLYDMSKEFQQVLATAMVLPLREQIALIAALSQRMVGLDAGTSLNELDFFLPLEDIALLRKRMEEVEGEKVETIPWQEALTRLKNKHG